MAQRIRRPGAPRAPVVSGTKKKARKKAGSTAASEVDKTEAAERFERPLRGSGSPLSKFSGEDRPSAGPKDALPRPGDESLSPEALVELSPSIIAEHLMALLANRRAAHPRAEVLAQVGDLVLQLEHPDVVRRALLAMREAGRIVDIYPLEVMIYVMERRPELVPRIAFTPFVLNKDELEARTFAVEEEISLRFPLALRLRGLALQGGGSPGYCVAPGPPGRYIIELGDEGRFTLLLRGEVKRKGLIDRLSLQIVGESPGSD